MDEQRIWAPWRLGYVAGDAAQVELPEPQAWRPGADQGCFLCRAAAEYVDAEAAARHQLVVHTVGDVLVMLNRYPYANGHLLIAPLRHVAELAQMSSGEHLAAMEALVEFTGRLRRLIRAEGFNIGLNIERVAGAGVPGHLHWHAVPRWAGDHNFMPVLAGVRIIPQSLEALWEALTAQIDEDSQ
jgi:ATP adenylyltransferase